MTRDRAVIGLTLLSALVFCAFAAPNAVALKGTTAFTCAPGNKGLNGFEDEHCTKSFGPNPAWEHVEIKPNIPTLLTTGNTQTSGELAFPKLKSTLGGVEFELEAGGFTSTPNKTSAENKENGVKQMEAVFPYMGQYIGVVVNKPKNCTVKNGEVALLEGSGKTVVKEIESKQEMYVEFVPNEKGVFSEFTFEGAECALKGTTAKVTGSAQANNTTEEGKVDGPTLRFTTTQTEKTLKVGAVAAKFEGTFTARMLPTIGQRENPIVLTTTAT
jgi:hypothetical protein